MKEAKDFSLGNGCRLALAVCLTACSVGAFAEVVAWYRFDELDPGVEATTATVIKNYAAPGTIEGTLSTYGTGGMLPMGTNSFGAKLQTWDPLTGNYHTNNRAMHFGTRAALASDATGAPGSRYSVMAANAGVLNDLTNITVEAIFRLNKDVPNGFTACIVDKYGKAAYQNRWGLTINSSGLWQRFRHCNTDGSDVGGVESFAGGAGKVTRGVWHHAAFTFDAAGKATLWLDYESVKSTKYAGHRLETGSSQFSIGCDPSVGNRTFPGEIDEVRISDRALAPSQFLRVKPVVEGLDPDTVFYQPFDYDEGPMPITAMDINAATNAGALVAKFEYLDFTNSVPQVSPDVPGTTGQLRQNLWAPANVNGGSMYSVTSEVDKATSTRVYDPNYTIYRGSFTAEMFFKGDTNKVLSSGSALTLMWGQLKVLLGATGTTRARAYVNRYGYTPATEIYGDSMRLFDGKWHHAAIVYDYAPSNFTYYVDYAPVGSVTARLYEGNDGYNHVFYFGRQVDNDNGPQFFPGWQDSLRIVRRALKPYEFLTTHEVSARSDTLAHIDFDSDFSVKPFPLLAPAGTGASLPGTSGEEARIDTTKKMQRIWLDGIAKTDVKKDLGSVRMDSSQVQFPNNSLLERPEFTIELFACLQSAPSGTPQFYRLNRAPRSWNHNSSWALQFDASTRRLKVHVYMKRFDGTFNDMTPDFSGASGKKVPIDGRWHHYALTSKLVDGTNTMLTAYIDYEPVGSPVTVEGVFYYPPAGTCLSVGAASPITGWLNEFRFSDGVLPVTSFMQAEPQGCTIIVR